MNLSSWFVDTVTCSAPSGARSSAGDPSFAAQRTVRCRVETKEQSVKIDGGRERRASHVVYSGEQIQLGERIWLPGADTGETGEAREVLLSGSTHNKRGTQTLYRVVVSAAGVGS